MILNSGLNGTRDRILDQKLAHATDVFNPDEKRDYEKQLGFNHYQRLFSGKSVEIGETGLGTDVRFFEGDHSGTVQRFLTVTKLPPKMSTDKIHKTGFHEGTSSLFTNTLSLAFVVGCLFLIMNFFTIPEYDGTLSRPIYLLGIICALAFLKNKINTMLQNFYWSDIQKIFFLPETVNTVYLLNVENTRTIGSYCENPEVRDQLFSLLAAVLDQEPSNAEFNEWVGKFSTLMTLEHYSSIDEIPTNLNDIREELKTALS